jgi:hypothetical protein
MALTADEQPSDGHAGTPGVGGRRSTGFSLKRLVRQMIQNSPGVVIAIAIHAVVGAVFLVLKMGHGGKEAEDTSIIPTNIARNSITDELPPEPELPDEPIERTAIPDNVEAELVANEVAELLPTEAPDPNRDLTQEIGDPNSVSDMPDSDPTGGTSIGVGAGGGHRGTGTPSPFAGRKLGTGARKGVRPSGPTQGTEEAIRLALIWLARHQNADGSWSAFSCKEHCPSGKPCQPETGAEAAGYSDKLDVGLTGLSLLCYLGAGFGHNARQSVVDTFRAKKIELGKDVVLPGLKWLVEHQQPDGSFTDPTLRSLYNDSLATLALCEAYGLSQNKLWKEPAQRAINFLCSAQKSNPNGTGKWGWRYTAPSDVEAARAEYGSDEAGFKAAMTDADTSVTGWCVMALKSAVISGLEVPQDAIDGAIAFNKWSSTANGLVGYVGPESAGVAIAGEHDTEFAFHAPSMAAVGMCIRVFLESNIEDPYLKQSADLIVKSLPSAGKSTDAKEKGRSLVDYYYWYYASLALNQLDGPDAPKRSNKYWPAWNKAMQDSILGLQAREEKLCTTGGFMAPDRWSFGIGPIYTTAINTLTLEVYYRYENAFGAAQNKKMKKVAKSKGQGGSDDDAQQPEKQQNP